jgi:peptide/nickel transport system substrate-binding protein
MRKALSLAIDRQILVDTGYGVSGRVTCNVVPAPENYASTGNDWCKTQDVAQANKLLDEAGWKKGSDGIRVKDGVRASILFQTSTNSVRQATQAFLKEMWSEIGVETELRNVSGSVFFGGDQSSPDTYQKFMADLEMFSRNFDGVDPEAYLAGWQCKNIPQPSNQWVGTNMSRFCDPDYDKLVGELGQTGDPAKRIELSKKLNDTLVAKGVVIPLIHRGRLSAESKTLAGHTLNAWDSELWDVAAWSREK